MNVLLEPFQQKRAALLHPEVRANKGTERFRDSEESGNALMEKKGRFRRESFFSGGSSVEASIPEWKNEL